MADNTRKIKKLKRKRKYFTKSKLHHIKVKMMSNQTVHKLTISLLNYLINMIKSDTKPNSFTVFRDAHFKNLLDSHINTPFHHLYHLRRSSCSFYAIQ